MWRAVVDRCDIYLQAFGGWLIFEALLITSWGGGCIFFPFCQHKVSYVGTGNGSDEFGEKQSYGWSQVQQALMSRKALW